MAEPRNPDHLGRLECRRRSGGPCNEQDVSMRPRLTRKATLTESLDQLGVVTNNRRGEDQQTPPDPQGGLTADRTGLDQSCGLASQIFRPQSRGGRTASGAGPKGRPRTANGGSHRPDGQTHSNCSRFFWAVICLACASSFIHSHMLHASLYRKRLVIL